jgi:hypothetical protein
VKLGAENRNKLIVAVVLMSLAAVLLLRMLFSSGPAPLPAPANTTSQAGPASAPRTRTTPRLRTSANRASRKVSSAPHSLDPTLRYDWLDLSEKTKYQGNGRNIFLAQAEIPKPIAPASPDRSVAQVPQGPPPPPPINLKFYGFASKPGEPKRVFLSQGEDVFIAGEGDIVDRRYKVLHISPMSVEIEDVLNNNRQSIPLTQG